MNRHRRKMSMPDTSINSFQVFMSMYQSDEVDNRKEPEKETLSPKSPLMTPPPSRPRNKDDSESKSLPGSRIESKSPRPLKKLIIPEETPSSPGSERSGRSTPESKLTNRSFEGVSPSTSQKFDDDDDDQGPILTLRPKSPSTENLKKPKGILKKGGEPKKTINTLKLDGSVVDNSDKSPNKKLLSRQTCYIDREDFAEFSEFLTQEELRNVEAMRREEEEEREKSVAKKELPKRTNPAGFNQKQVISKKNPNPLNGSSTPSIKSSSKTAHELIISIKPPNILILFFYAANNPTCGTFSTNLDKEVQLFENVSLHKIDTEKDPKAVESLKISEVPCLVSYKGGKLLEQVSGTMTRQQMNEFLKRAVDPSTKSRRHTKSRSVDLSFVSKISTQSQDPLPSSQYHSSRHASNLSREDRSPPPPQLQPSKSFLTNLVVKMNKRILPSKSSEENSPPTSPVSNHSFNSNSSLSNSPPPPPTLPSFFSPVSPKTSHSSVSPRS